MDSFLNRIPGKKRDIAMQRITAVWPYCYHVTYSSNLRPIHQFGTLFAAETLLQMGNRPDVVRVRQRRLGDIAVQLGAHEVLVRNQEPLDPQALTLDGACEFEDYVALLNTYTFFWPGTAEAPIHEGLRMFDRTPASAAVLLRVPTSSLVQENGEKNVGISTCNSGAAWFESGQRCRRGRDVITSMVAFSGDPYSIVEISVRLRAKLPRGTTYSRAAAGPWRRLFDGSSLS